MEEKESGRALAEGVTAEKPPFQQKTKAQRRKTGKKRKSSRPPPVEAPRDPTAGILAQRAKLAKTPCCQCTRASTCSRPPSQGVVGCSCLALNNNCTGCKCWKHCRNRIDRGRSADKIDPSQTELTNFLFGSSSSHAAGVEAPPSDPPGLHQPPAKHSAGTAPLFQAAIAPLLCLPAKAGDNPLERTTEVAPTPTNVDLTDDADEALNAEATAPATEEDGPTEESADDEPEDLTAGIVGDTLGVAETVDVDSDGNSETSSEAEETVAPETTEGTPTEARKGGTAAVKKAPVTDVHEDATEVADGLAFSQQSTADMRLAQVYGDTVHRNDGTHLSGGTNPDLDQLWRKWWRQLVCYSPSHYTPPKGKVGKRFLAIYTAELKGCRSRKWNAERAIVFTMVILQRKDNLKKSRDIRRRLTSRMDLWERGRFAALVVDTRTVLSRSSAAHVQPDAETRARQFNNRVLSGRLREAVRNLTNREGGGVLFADDVDTKTGKPVIDVLRGKHPAMRVPNLADPTCCAFEPYSSAPDAVPLDINGDDVADVAARLSGAAGLGGTDAVELRDWCLRYGRESELLREEIAAWAEMLANDRPPWALYRAYMACRLVALDKEPGVRPLGIGEVLRRLIAKLVIKTAGESATAACGSLNLCAGLAAGIEGAVHAVGERRAKAASAAKAASGTADAAPSGAAYAAPGEAAGAASMDAADAAFEGAANAAPSEAENTMDAVLEEFNSGLQAQPPAGIPAPGELPDPPGDKGGNSQELLLLVDARNGFNELSRMAMLWTVRHTWPAGARFAYNCYRHHSLLVVRCPGGKVHLIYSKEGVTQGDPLSMLLYGLTLAPLAASLKKLHPDVLSPSYADDLAFQARIDRIRSIMQQLLLEGPSRGYFPEPSKSIIICEADILDIAKTVLAEFDFRYHDGHRYVGSFMGSATSCTDWLRPKVAEWAAGVTTLAAVARKYPQTAYAGLTLSLQQEWQYTQRVLPVGDEEFAPIEQAIREDFLPALLGEPDDPVDDSLRDLLALSVSFAGAGIPNPTETRASNYAASVACTEVLVASLQSDDGALSVEEHNACVRQARLANRTGRLEGQNLRLLQLEGEVSPSAAKRMERCRTTGAWLTCAPVTLNGTALSADEFRDSFRIRFGKTPLNMPKSCDGCHKKFSVDHGLSCRKGGLITTRHDDMSHEWQALCRQAFKPKDVSDEPFINSSRAADLVRGPDGKVEHQELRGDFGVNGFWVRGRATIFDVRICDTTQPSYRGQTAKGVLSSQEQHKKKKYLDLCLERRRHFTPLIFSVDGLVGSEATAAMKNVATRLAGKWKQPYSATCGFVKSRISFALVRSTSMCLRNSRDVHSRVCSPVWADGAGLSLYR